MTKKKLPLLETRVDWELCSSHLRWMENEGKIWGFFFFDPLEGVGVAKGFNRKARSFYLFITQTRTQRCVSFVQANKTKGTGRWDRMTRTNRPVGSSAPNNTLVHPPTPKKKIISAAIVELWNRNSTAHYEHLKWIIHLNLKKNRLGLLTSLKNNFNFKIHLTTVNPLRISKKKINCVGLAEA